MDSSRWERIKDIFSAALELTGEERARYLDSACAGEGSLRQEIDQLLDQHENVGVFLSYSALEPQPVLAQGDLLEERYRVIRMLGRGGMGEVYEMEDLVLGERVAIKTLRGSFADDESEHRQLQREIQAARRVTHRNVCRVFDAGVHAFGDGRPLPFFSMELLEGETLAAYLRRRGRLTREEAFPLALQMAQGLAAAHQAGVIHRDFKPANVMLVPVKGEQARAVITDFGLARIHADQGQPSTTRAQLRGTLAYMSPEQLSGEPVTAASDIYSFGVVLYEMATGHTPFDDRHLLNAAVQRTSGRIPGLRRDAPDISPRWEQVIERCLRPSPADRYTSGADLAECFRDEYWRVPHPQWTRLQWIAVWSGLTTLMGAAAGTFWWTHQPYQPSPVAMGWYEKGVASFHTASYDAARKSLEVAVKEDPRFATAFAYLAVSLSALDRPDPAREALLKAHAAEREARVTPTDAERIAGFEAIVLRDFDRAKSTLAELASGEDSPAKAAALTELALVDTYRGDLPAAAAALETVLRIDPTFAPARMRLGWVLSQQRKFEPAAAAFSEAERLFRAASEYDALTETLYQRGLFLNRFNRSAEALPVIEEAARLASTTGDIYHRVRAQLTHSLTLQQRGQLQQARDEAAEAARWAQENGLEQSAAVGLLDLGNTYLAAQEPEEAERYFKQGLEYARHAKARFSEARALLSLGSLCVQYSRVKEAVPYIEAGLPFLRERGYRLEAAQGSLLLGGAQSTLGNFSAAEKTLSEVIATAVEIQNSDLEATAHSYLADLNTATGNWPGALREIALALERSQNARAGASAVTFLITQARVEARMGTFSRALEDLGHARTRLASLEGKQLVRHAALALADAEIAYFQGRWADAGRLASTAPAGGGLGDQLGLACIRGLAQIRLGRIDRGFVACRDALVRGEKQSLIRATEGSRLLLAEALAEAGRPADARGLASQALAFYDSRGILEGVWRCQRLLGDTSSAPQSISQLRAQWPPEVADSYFARPDLRLSDR